MSGSQGKWWWLVASAPLGLGLVSAVIINRSISANPILFMRANLSTFAWLLGLWLSLLLVAVGGWWLSKGQHRRTVVEVQTQAAEDRRRFLQRLDHELKNPLMAIRAGLVNFADAPTPPARLEALTSVEAQAVRLSRLTADLRKIAELETRPLERSAIDLAQLLQEAISLVNEQPGATNHHLTLTVPQAPWPLPTISGDWDLIFLAVYNLLENALKFTGPEDTVEIRAREDGRFVVIEVADTGPGIESGELPHVWEELYRGQGARGVPGSGLGMALVKAVTERHGGSIALHSRVRQGTVVTMRLPIGSV